MQWQQLGALLKAARRQAGLTQERLASLLSDHMGTETSQQSIQHWERGKYRPVDRLTTVGLCYVLHRAGGLESLEQVNELLSAADHGALHLTELETWFPAFAVADPADNGSAVTIEAVSVEEECTSGVEQTDHQEWFECVLRRVGAVREVLGAPERYGAVAAIALAFALLSVGWLSTQFTWGIDDRLIWVACLWTSSVVLTVPPSQRETSTSLIVYTKLLRLSGCACGVLVLVATIVWLDALWSVLFGVTLAHWIVYGVSAVGAALTYVMGLHVQQRFSVWTDGMLAKRTASEVTAAMLLGQFAIGWLALLCADYYLLFAPAALGLIAVNFPTSKEGA